MKLVIFGAGRIADIALEIFAARGVGVAALTCDAGSIPEGGMALGHEVVPMADVVGRFPPREHAAFVAVGYHRLNKLRSERIAALRDFGYALATCVSPDAHVARSAQVADNCLVMPGAALETGARLGEGAFLFSNAVVGHHAMVGENAWIAAGAVIGGGADVGARCFIGLGAVIGHEVVLGEDSFMGASSIVTRSAAAESVFITGETPRARVNSRQFMAITKLR